MHREITSDHYVFLHSKDSVLKNQVPLSINRHFSLPGSLLLRLYQNPLETLEDLVKRFGDTIHFTIGPTHVFLLSNPEDIKEVFGSQHGAFHIGRELFRTKPVFGNGLLTSEGDIHTLQRKAFHPAFHRTVIATFSETMIKETLALQGKWQDKETVNMNKTMSLLTLDTLGKTLFNTDMSPYLESFIESLDTVFSYYNWVGIFQSLWEQLQPPSIMMPLRFRQAHKNMRKISQILLQQHNGTENNPGALLSIMKHLHQDSTYDREVSIIDEIITFCVAGYESTTDALIWTWYLLSQYPEVEKKLHEELNRVLGERTPTIEDLPNLSYTKMIFAESMRLYPPVWILGRRAMHDIHIGEYVIPANSYIAASQYIVQRRAEFFKDPLLFYPERWEQKESQSQSPFQYFPFGAGSRVCIGESYARMEVLLILATLAQRWRFRLLSTSPIKMQPLIVLRSKHELIMEATKR